MNNPKNDSVSLQKLVSAFLEDEVPFPIALNLILLGNLMETSTFHRPLQFWKKRLR